MTSVEALTYVRDARKDYVPSKIVIDNIGYDIETTIQDKSIDLVFEDTNALVSRLGIQREQKKVEIPAFKLTADVDVNNVTETFRLTYTAPAKFSCGVVLPDYESVKSAIRSLIAAQIDNIKTENLSGTDYYVGNPYLNAYIAALASFDKNEPLSSFATYTQKSIYESAISTGDKTAKLAESFKRKFISDLNDAVSNTDQVIADFLINAPKDLPGGEPESFVYLYEALREFSRQFGAEADLAGHTSGGSAPGSEPTATEVIDIIRPILSGIMDKLDNLKFSDFKKGGSFNTELHGYVNELLDNDKDIAYKSPISTRLGEDTAENLNPEYYNGALGQEGVKATAQKAFSDLKTENPKFSNFVTLGSEGKLIADDTKRLYTNFVGLSNVLGLDAGPIASTPPDESVKSDTTKAPVTPDTGEAGTAGSTETGTTGGQTSSTGTPPTAQPTPAPKPRDYVYFYYKFIRVDPTASPPPKLVVKFPGTGQTREVVIDPSELGDRLEYVVNDDNRELFQTPIDNATLTVIATAVPFTGGEPVTIKKQIPFSSKPPSVPPVLPFSFTDVRGKTISPGVKSGGSAVADDGTKQGSVTQVFYTDKGGISTSTTDATCKAKGTTYTFTFESGFVIPVELRQPLKESAKKVQLNEAGGTVPHWLFIKPGSGKAAGGQGAGGQGAGGQGAGAGTGSGTRVNVVVKAFQIKTTDKWIKVPNTGNPWDLGTFKVEFADGSAGVPGIGRVLSAAEARSIGGAALAQALFVKSEAWSKTGIDCFGDDPTVTGYDSSITTREFGRPVTMVSG